MFIFIQNGRLGNQAFQYLALRQFFDEHLVLVGFASLKRLLKSSSFNRVTILPFESDLLRHLLTKAVKFFSDFRLITLYYEINTPYKYELKKKIGLFRWPKFIGVADFQHPLNASKIPPSLITLKKSLQNSASERIDFLKKQFPKSTLVFVHIRRGDYARWPTLESPAVLPSRWYINAMNIIRKRVKKPLFLILTDDIPYAKDIFCENSDVVIASNDEFLDIAIMAGCSCGILSASSFSWLGAYLAYSESIQTTKPRALYFIAPTPWIIEQPHHVPPSLHSPWLTLIPRGLDNY